MHQRPASSLEVDRLEKSYRMPAGRSIPAVRDFTLRVEPGEFLTLLGPSGCGKTTVLRVLAGLEEPDFGEILLDGRSITTLPPHRRRIGLVFQNYALFPHMTVFENVAYSLRIRGEREHIVRSDVTAALTAVGLDDLVARPPGRLSGGQQQRVALARALVMKPDLLLFDEPLSNLDAKLRVQVRGELRRLQQSLGTTAVFVTHDQDEAMSLSDRIAVMNAGHVEQIGTPEEVYARPSSLFVADFVGKVNVLPGRVLAHDSGRTLVETLQHRIEVAATYPPGTEVLLVVRPEAILLRSVTPHGLSGIAEELAYHGDRIEYRIRVTGTLITVTEPALNRPERVAVGDRVGLDLVAQAIHLLPTIAA
jgi:iron(III) transport system ATP-binding protein